MKRKIDLFDPNTNDRAEFKGQIIDIFEDYLDNNDYKLNNVERDQAIEDGDYDDPDEAAHIWGDDYDAIGDEVEFMLDNNGTSVAKANIVPIISAFENLCDKSNISISTKEHNALLQKVTETLTNWGITVTA